MRILSVGSASYPLNMTTRASRFIAACLSGCAQQPIRAVGNGVTTLDNFISGHFIPVHEFTTQDTIYFYVSVTWDDVSKENGYRVVEWNWYKDGNLVVHHENDHAYFKSAPNTRSIKEPAEALGKGHIRAEFLIDGIRVAQEEFDIK